ncbi:MAG TPA: hypothetical protein VG937_09590 [Polyangiaceae bacterium]|nr:hypothetical protein [Polyangiaceae bacterium]
MPARKIRELPALGALLFALATLSSGSASATEKRTLPDYDGRGGKPTTPGDVLLWGPRVVFFPLYVTSEFVLRRPLGFLISNAERAKIPAALYDFFAFGPDHKAGIVPVAFIDFGFRPSVGIYGFWDDAGFKGHGLRLHASTGGSDWLAGSFTERFTFANSQQVTFNVGAIRRPDYAYYGPGPTTVEDDLSRYSADRFEARAVAESRLFGSSRIEGGFGYRGMSFSPGKFGGNPTLEDREAEGLFPLPDGYERGYRAGFSRLKLSLDTRGVDAISRSGLRLELEAEQGSDLQRQSEPQSWLRYSAALGAFVDLGDSGRVMSLSVATLFADPLASGPVPFTELPTLGGPGLMPGFREGRLRDRSGAVATLRYTWPIWIWLDGSLQGAVGNVFGRRLDGFDPSLLRFSTAVGIESHSSPDSVLQLLFGVGSETFESGARVDSIRLTVGARGGL